MTTAELTKARMEYSSGSALVEWLVTRALPMWSTVGVDRVAGGFFEKIDLAGEPVHEARRARVVARQIYVFATAARRGWLDDADALVEHGLAFLLGKMRRPDGTYASAVTADGAVANGTFDLYEHAFILFALAAASRGRPDRAARLRPEAESILRRLREHWSHPIAGFEEASPRTLPLKSNPHMHMLEAALAWAALSDGEERNRWDALTDELVELCLGRFVDARSGALREYFDGDWHPMPDASGRLVEPGHQFEWSWLLLQSSRHAARPVVRDTAVRLLEIGETHGVDPVRGVAFDALDDDFRMRDGAAKLWPQTERIKAWHAARETAIATATAQHADRQLAAAVDGLGRYLLASPAGLWHEQMRADGGFVEQHCRASSLYHIVCAIDTIASHPSTVLESSK